VLGTESADYRQPPLAVSQNRLAKVLTLGAARLAAFAVFSMLLLDCFSVLAVVMVMMDLSMRRRILG
jgi:hypothetical protein